jgi:hypothetical protein
MARLIAPAEQKGNLSFSPFFAAGRVAFRREAGLIACQEPGEHE